MRSKCPCPAFLCCGKGSVLDNLFFVRYNKAMRILLSTLLLTSAMACADEPSVTTQTLWAAGVSEKEGWYDFNKAPDGSESELCWAITAANLIAWWQNAADAKQLPANIPMGQEVWQTYRSSFTNEGSDPDQGMRWWFSGKYEPTSPGTGEQCAAVTRDGVGAYYTHVPQGGDHFLWNLLYRGRGAQANAQTLSQAFISGFLAGDAFWIGVAYRRPNGALHTHALTVWGADIQTHPNGSKTVSAIYITDSDDRLSTLHRIPVITKDNNLIFHCPTHPLYARIGEIRITNYTGLKAKAGE